MNEVPARAPAAEYVPRFYRTAATIVWVVLKLFFRLRVYGRENVPRNGACILAANHASYLDPPILGAAVRFRAVRFLAQAGLFEHRWMNWFLRHALVVPVRRGHGDVAALRRAIAMLKEGACLGIFPEGTRTPNGALGEAKGGIGFLVAQARAPVIPVFIAGTYRAWPRWRKWPRPGTVSVHIGRPIMPDEIAAYKRDYAAVAARILAAIAALEPTHRAQEPSPRASR